MNIKVDRNGVSRVEINGSEKAKLRSALVLCKLLAKHGPGGSVSTEAEIAGSGLSKLLNQLDAPPPAVQQPARALATVAESESAPNDDDSFDDPSDSE